MKTEPSLEYAEMPRLAIWTAVAIAFGLLLHRVFFLVALMIALLTPFNSLMEWLREQQHSPLPPRH